MEAVATGNEFFDFETPPNLFTLVEKDEDDQFPLKVSGKKQISPDTYEFTLEFPNPEWIAGLWAGGHFVFHVMIDGKRVTRKYTPISPVNEKGKAIFVIKVYREDPAFPDGGKFTQHLEKNINVGDSILCEGPIGMLKYHGHGKFVLKKKELKPKKRIGLLAGGSGITPMYSIALASSLAKDGLEIWFLFSNKTKDDMLCKEQLDKLAETNPNFHLFHTLTRHDEVKDGPNPYKSGRVTYEMFKECGFPEPADDVFIATCGPKNFNDQIRGFLAENGYEEGEMRA